MTTIETLDDFRDACARHDLTYHYSDDSRCYRAGDAEFKRIREASTKFPMADVERIWNEVVDQKMLPNARSQFYWHWPRAPGGRPTP
jgi:hypothetical protein